MNNRIRYSPEALQDLNEIWDHIMLDFDNPKSAARLIDEIQDHIDRLETFPEMGARLSSIADVISDYRFLVIGKYMAFYRVSGGYIYIDRILYGRRNYLRILFGADDN